MSFDMEHLPVGGYIGLFVKVSLKIVILLSIEILGIGLLKRITEKQKFIVTCLTCNVDVNSISTLLKLICVKIWHR